MKVLALFVVLALTGCTGAGEREAVAPPEPEVVTVTPSPTGPPTYLRVNLIQNQIGERSTLQMQAFSLDSKGEENYAGYSIRSVAVSTAAKQYPTQPDWPLCNERMEGIRIKLFSMEEGGGELVDDRIWDGIHCMGDAGQFAITIVAGPELRFGAY